MFFYFTLSLFIKVPDSFNFVDVVDLFYKLHKALDVECHSTIKSMMNFIGTFVYQMPCEKASINANMSNLDKILFDWNKMRFLNVKASLIIWSLYISVHLNYPFYINRNEVISTDMLISLLKRRCLTVVLNEFINIYIYVCDPGHWNETNLIKNKYLFLFVCYFISIRSVYW